MSGSAWAPGSTVQVNSNNTLVTERQTAAAGQTLVNLASFTYPPGTSSLLVMVNGVVQDSGADYSETSSSSITFFSGLSLGDRITFFGFTAIVGIGASGNVLFTKTVTPGDASVVVPVLAGYTKYFFELYGFIPSTIHDDLWMLTSKDGGATYNDLYEWMNAEIGNGLTPVYTGQFQGVGDSKIIVANAVGELVGNSAAGFSGVIETVTDLSNAASLRAFKYRGVKSNNSHKSFDIQGMGTDFTANGLVVNVVKFQFAAHTIARGKIIVRGFL